MYEKDGAKGNKSKKKQFQKVCGQALLELQKYKLRTNLIECRMSKIEVQKYFSYYTNKSKKRLEYSKSKIKQLSQIFETNQLYLQSLQLKSINNMMHAHKQRINNCQPTNSTKYQHYQQILLQVILSQDQQKLNQIQVLLNNLKTQNDKDKSPVIQEDQNKTEKMNNIKYEEVLKLINKCEVQNHRCFQHFQRSVANMVNQLYCHLEKLVQFFNVWDNLGSSLIYEMKCQREVLIDTALSIHKKDHITPTIQNIKNQQTRLDQQHYEDTRLTCPNTNKNTSKIDNLEVRNKLIQKLSYYETSNNKQVRQCTFDDRILLREQQNGFYRYTYEQLQHQTKQYLQQLLTYQEAIGSQRHTHAKFDRSYVYCDKEQINRVNDRNSRTRHKLVPQMNISCWYDRWGYKDAFSILDFPSNLVQRKLQFECDRHFQMQQMNERRRKRYKSKQQILQAIHDQNIRNKQISQVAKIPITQEQHFKIAKPNWEQQQKGKEKQTKERQDMNTNLEAETETKTKNNSKIEIKHNMNKSEIPTNQINIARNSNKKISKYEIQKFEQQIQQISKKRIKLFQSRQQVEQKEKQRYKQKQKQPLQMFTIRYLPEYQKQMLRKVKLKKEKLGLGQQEIQPLSFAYMADYQVPTIKQCLSGGNAANNEGNINKTYIVNKHMYIKIQPLFFRSRTRMFKIIIYLGTQINQLQQLKSKLQTVLSHYGKCAFYINSDLISPQMDDNAQLYILIGSLLRNIKQDGNVKEMSKTQPNNTINLRNLLEQGKPPYESFILHYKRCKDL